MAKAQNKEEKDFLYLLATLVGKVVERVLLQKADIKVYGQPRYKRKSITAFMKNMRISGLEKFNEQTYISYINFYRKDADLKKDRPVGAFILYLPDFFTFTLMKKLGYPVDSETDYGALEDATGSFCNVLAGSFKNGLKQLGYEELVMSHFSTAINDVVDGVPYDGESTELFEASFDIWGGEKILVADISMGAIENEKGGFLDVYMK